MHSHHSHSGQYCTHAVGQLEECIQEAIRQNFTLFCLTEHIPRYRVEDLYPGESQTPVGLVEMFAGYHAHARHLQEKYATQITIHVGLESEFIRDVDLLILELLIAKYPIDFMVGSVHHVHGVPIDFDKAKWLDARATCTDDESFYGTYFDHQLQVLQKFQPLVVGHFDVILLFAPEETDLLSFDSVREKIKRNISLVAQYGGMFELNSAAFRKGWKTAYPKPNILQLMVAAGGKFCLSDDSHGPLQVGLNYHRVLQYITEQGLSGLSHLKKSEGSLTVETNASTLHDFTQWTQRRS